MKITIDTLLAAAAEAKAAHEAAYDAKIDASADYDAKRESALFKHQTAKAFQDIAAAYAAQEEISMEQVVAQIHAAGW